MKPKKHEIISNGNRLMVYEWPGQGPPILLAHATGFHARVWGQVVKQLSGKHIVAFDFMGHGQSDHNGLPASWRPYTQNVIDVARECDLHGALAVGHSMGGYCVVMAAARLSDRFGGLLLLDPVIGKKKLENIFKSVTPEQFPVARRRNVHQSHAEFFESLKNKLNFDLWDEQVLRDYCQYGLVQSVNSEGYQLACEPLYEAASYVNIDNYSEIYDQLKKIMVPVDIVRACLPEPGSQPFNFTFSPTDPGVVNSFQQGRDIYLPNMTHFIPMQDPVLTAQMILDLYERVVEQKAA